MLRKRFNIYLCVLALLFGAGIYALLRENTYVSIWINNLVDLSSGRYFCKSYSNVFVKYYLPDFLWALGLCSGLNVVFENELKNIVLSGVLTLISGLIWELMQLLDIVSGTGDIIDILLYLSASIIVVMINIITYRRRK